VSLTLFEPAISGHFYNSIRDLPHVPLLPLKALAPLLYPVFVYIGWRFQPTSTESARTASRLTSSFLSRQAREQRDIAAQDWQFWRAHMFSLRMIAALVLVLANEVALLLLPVNVALLFFSTLGFPLWRKQARTVSPRAQTVLRSAVFTSVSIWAVVMLLINMAVPLSPILVDVLVFHGPNFGVILTIFALAFSCLVSASLWHMSYRIAETVFEWFSPTAAYLWVFNEFIGRKVWRWVVAVLEQVTDLCYPLRRLRFLFVGEFILSGAVLVWVAWPVFITHALVPPQYPARMLLLFMSAQMSVFLMHRAYHVVRNRWRKLAHGKTGVRSELQLKSIVPRLAAESRYGFVLEINGEKHPALHIQQARMVLKGREFWASLSAAMGPFWITVIRNAFHPFVLMPMFMDPAPLTEGVTNVSARFVFGTEEQPKLIRVSRRMLRRYLERVVATGDPSVEIVIDYGERSWGLWVIRGRVVSFRLQVSALLSALWSEHPVNILETGGARITSH
jgi:hypothetical protein